MNRERYPLTRRWQHGLLILGLTLLSFSFWWLLKTPPVTGQVPEPPATAPNPLHQMHVGELELSCTDCHETAKAPKPGHELSFSVRPGHSACDGCHEDEFEKKKVTAEYAATAFCMRCHTGKGDAVGPFPSGKLTLARFSHASHVDPHPLISKRLGIREDCIFCHKVEAEAASPGRPGHPECAACHSGSRAAKPILAKEDVVEPCLACHSLERVDRNMMQTAGANPHAGANPRLEPKPRAGLNPHAGVHGVPAAQHPYRDIRPFNHGSHLKRRDGAPIDCTVCHKPVLQEHTLETASRLPTMRECATCHDNATFVHAEHLIKRCESCHTIIRAHLRPQASDPVSPAIAHTEVFRVYHRDQARDPDNQCGVCHIGFVNVGQGNCAGCHSSMLPRSHRILRWRDWLHGRLAGFDRKECANCHSGDFCTRCHTRVLPRSHIPLQTFAVDPLAPGGRTGGGHRDLAILNLRSCFVCHTFERTCARCHRRVLQP